MHESFIEFLDRKSRNNNHSPCREFARIARNDARFKTAPALIDCLYRIYEWDLDKETRECYANECARIWTHWLASERRHVENEFFAAAYEEIRRAAIA